MAFASNQYTGDGSTVAYSIIFPYIDQDHVYVEVDGVDTGFTFTTSSIVTLDSAPADGSVIIIGRRTPKVRYVDYVNGSIQDAEDFDLDSTQLLYLILESIDEQGYQLSRIPTENDNKMYVDIDMNGFIITGLGEGSADDDAARLIDIDNKITEALQGLTPGDGGTIPDASTTQKGVVELATDSEALSGTDTLRVITPSGLKYVLDNSSVVVDSATELVEGVSFLATQAEVISGTEATKNVTPATLQAKIDAIPSASETEEGLVELATNAETVTGTDASKATTPAGVKAAIDNIPSASDTEEGLIEIATQAEVDALTDGTKAVTPETLGPVLEYFGVNIGYAIVGYGFSDDFVIANGQRLSKATYVELNNTLGSASNIQEVDSLVNFGPWLNDETAKSLGYFNGVYILAIGDTLSGADGELVYTNGVDAPTIITSRYAANVRFAATDNVIIVPGDATETITNGRLLRSVDGMSFSTVDTGSANVILDVFRQGTNLYVFDSNADIYQSTDDGATWSLYAEIDESTLNLILPLGVDEDGDIITMTSDDGTSNIYILQNTGSTINVVDVFQATDIDVTITTGATYNCLFNNLVMGFNGGYAVIDLSNRFVSYIFPEFALPGVPSGLTWLTGDTYIASYNTGEVYLTNLTDSVTSSLRNNTDDLRFSTPVVIKGGTEVISAGATASGADYNVYIEGATLTPSTTDFVNLKLNRSIQGPYGSFYVKAK